MLATALAVSAPLWPAYADLQSPLSQIKSGTPLEGVECSPVLVLLESPRGTPACVRDESVDLLVLRGFAPVGTPAEPALAHMPAGSPHIDNIVSSNNRFSVDFYRQVGGGDDNVFFSPTNMYVAFSILYEGARGDTAAELGDVFGIEPDAVKRRAEMAELMSVLNREDPNYDLHAANALWIDSGHRDYVRDAYIDLARDHYMVHVEVLSLADAGADRINEWSSENTNGKLDDISTEDDFIDRPLAALTSAIYFNANWTHQFPEEGTTTGKFWTTGSSSVDAEMMSLEAVLPHASLDGLSLLELPYKGDRLSMLVALPTERGGIMDLEESMTPGIISKWREDLSPTDVRVVLPKFRMETEYGLNAILEGMGIRKIFKNGDLSGINLPEVSSARHNAFVDVSERGTEAAATTIITFSDESVDTRPVFRADHPFIFMIQDDETGALLFMGRVMDPTI